MHFDIFCGDLKQIRLRQEKFHREGYLSFPGRVTPVTASHRTSQLIMINYDPPEVRHILLRNGPTEIVNLDVGIPFQGFCFLIFKTQVQDRLPILLCPLLALAVSETLL